MDQTFFTFVPHVLAIRAGESVRFTNSDNANHNVHCFDPREPFNEVSIPGLEIARRFDVSRGARPLELRCDVHPWMRAWIYVFDHPWFAVTDALGRFEIADVPVGRHILRMAHADGNLVATINVDVSEHETVEARFEVSAEDARAR